MASRLMPTLPCIMSIDPGVVNELRLFLPMGSNALGKVPDLRKLKWEYTVVFMRIIEELREMLHDYPHVIKNAYHTKLDVYWHACSYMGIFENFQKFFPSAKNPPKIDEEFLCLMMEALVKDVSLFQDEAPQHLFLGLEEWKIHQTYEMLHEMKMEPMNCYDAVKAVYTCYEYQKSRNGGNHDFAMEALKTCQNLDMGFGAPAPSASPRNPILLSTMCFATLMDRIYKLEGRLKNLEKLEPEKKDSSKKHSSQKKRLPLDTLMRAVRGRIVSGKKK